MKQSILFFIILVAVFMLNCGSATSSGILINPQQYKCGSNWTQIGNMKAICVPSDSESKEELKIQFNYRCGSNDYKIEKTIELGKRVKFMKNCYEAGKANFELDYNIEDNSPTLKMKSVQE